MRFLLVFLLSMFVGFVFALVYCSSAQAQYEGQVVVTYDGPSEFAPTYQQQVAQSQGYAAAPVYSGGSSGGAGGYSTYRPMYGAAPVYSGGSSGGTYTGGSSGGQAMMYRQAAPVYYQQPVRYYSAPPVYTGWGGNGAGAGMGFSVGPFSAGIGAGFGGGGRQMVCGPNGCHYQ